MTSGEAGFGKIEELIPFWVNGTLTAEEAAAVARAVDREPRLAADARAAKDLRARMRGMMPSDRSPGEFGLARLRRAVADRPLAVAAGWRRPAVAAAVAAAVTAAGFYLAGRGDDPSALYRQASGPRSDAAFTVFIHEEATQSALTDFLLENGLTIVDGPSALGFYRLAVVEGADARVAEAALLAAGNLLDLVDSPE